MHSKTGVVILGGLPLELVAKAVKSYLLDRRRYRGLPEYAALDAALAEMQTVLGLNPRAQQPEFGNRDAKSEPVDPHWCSTSEAAEILGVGIRMVGYLAAGLGGIKQANGRWLIPRDAVMAEAERRNRGK